MLCSSKTKRPDRLLQNKLVKLAYSIIALTITLIMFMIYPQYFIYLILLSVAVATLCLSLTIKTLNAAEEAISYGGFANEIIRNDYKGKRIDNALGEPIIQNDNSRDLFKNQNILEFLKKNISDNSISKAALHRLKTACNTLITEKVILSLNLKPQQDKIFSEEQWFEVTVRPLFLKKADIFEAPFSILAVKKETYMFWSTQDITAQKNMEKIFQEEKKTSHDFLDYLPVGLYTADKDYRLEYTNHAFAQAFGYSREEIIGQNLHNLIAKNAELPSKHNQWQGKMHFVNKNNEVFETYMAQEIFRDSEGVKTRGVIVKDLPSEMKLKEELNLSFDKISWLFNFAPVGIIFTNNDSVIQDCNDASSEFLQNSRENIVNHNFFDFISTEDTATVKKEIIAILDNQKSSAYIDVHIKQDKENKIAVVYISPMKKFYSANKAAIDGLVMYLIDATQQKSLELQFAQAQKMQALGQMAGGVSHDFNNLLTAMIGFCDLLLQRHGIGDPSFADLIQIKQNANRAAGLVRQLLAFSRKQPLKPKLIDVTENFTELSHMLKRILGEQVFLKFYHGSDLGYIRVDPVQFSQVIINLAINAKDAMNNNGTLSISTHTETLNEAYQFGADTIKPGEFVVIEVKDSGCGIPQENLTRIFDPFFSTKQNVVGSGTGLGLAMVYGIVRQTEGYIKVDSELNVGTTFSIHLPKFESDREFEAEKSTKDNDIITSKDGTPVLTVQEKINSPVTINEKLIFGLNVSTIDRRMDDNSKDISNIRILFTEDEDSVRAFAVRALKKKGYDVIGCNSAENAIEHLQSDKNFNLLITDMVMPGMSGAELAKIVKEEIPNIKVILASGYSEEIARKELASSDDFEFMAKPFSLGDLTKKVFDVLNSL